MNNLKIAYIYLNPLPIAGVDKKPIQQAEAIKKLGIKYFDIYVLNPSVEKHEAGLHFVKYKTPKPIQIDYLFRQNFWRFKIIEQNVPLDKYDYIILRYPKADKSGVKFAKKYNLITEHHTDEIVELKLEGQIAKSLVVKVFKYLRFYLENRFGKLILRHCIGIIGVTKELEKFEAGRIKKNINYKAINSKTITNGINVSSVKLDSFKSFDNKKLNIAIVGSHYLPWHGIERIIKSIKNYTGDVNIIFHVIGEFEEISKYCSKSNIIFHGKKYGEELNSFLKTMNLAFSTMALYTKKMNEATPLKTREYVSRGIPFILAYKDTDLIENPPKKQFYLEFPNDDSLIDFEKIISFVREINEKYEPEELSAYMRFYAEKYLDWTVKMQHYVDFVNEIEKEKAI